jgi:hypothetical protein
MHLSRSCEDEEVSGMREIEQESGSRELSGGRSCKADRTRQCENEPQ